MRSKSQGNGEALCSSCCCVGAVLLLLLLLVGRRPKNTRGTGHVPFWALRSVILLTSVRACVRACVTAAPAGRQPASRRKRQAKPSQLEKKKKPTFPRCNTRQMGKKRRLGFMCNLQGLAAQKRFSAVLLPWRLPEPKPALTETNKITPTKNMAPGALSSHTQLEGVRFFLIASSTKGGKPAETKSPHSPALRHARIRLPGNSHNRISTCLFLLEKNARVYTSLGARCVQSV